MRYACPSCRKSLRFKYLKLHESTKGILKNMIKNDEYEADGFCPYCSIALKRNAHGAEETTGRIIFPALIFATVCVVIFAYILQIWLLILGFGAVLAALVFEQVSISRQIPHNWNRWKVAGTRKRRKITAVDLVIVTSMLMVIAAKIVRTWPEWGWLELFGVILGGFLIVHMAHRYVSNYKNARRRQE